MPRAKKYTEYQEYSNCASGNPISNRAIRLEKLQEYEIRVNFMTEKAVVAHDNNEPKIENKCKEIIADTITTVTMECDRFDFVKSELKRNSAKYPALYAALFSKQK